MGKHKRSAETLDEIQKAALDLFGRKGLAGTSVDDIAEMARITKGALYYHFESKEDLFLKICEVAVKEYQKEVFDRSFASIPSPSCIRSLIINSHRFDKNFPQYSRLYSRMIGEDDRSNKGMVPKLLDLHVEYGKLTEKMVQHDIDNGIVKPMDVGPAATLLMAILDGLTIRDMTYAASAGHEIDIEGIADLVLNGLC